MCAANICNASLPTAFFPAADVCLCVYAAVVHINVLYINVRAHSMSIYTQVCGSVCGADYESACAVPPSRDNHHGSCTQ